jgi:hypothetical protein
MDRTDRLLAIVLELQQAGRWRAGDLAATFEGSQPPRAPALEYHPRRAYHRGGRWHEERGRGGTAMQGNQQARGMQVLGWVLVFIGMLLPTVFIVAAPRWLIFIVPLSCAILVLGLVLVAGRWPPGRDAA